MEFIPEDEWYCDYCNRAGKIGNNPIVGIFTRNRKKRLYGEERP